MLPRIRRYTGTSRKWHEFSFDYIVAPFLKVWVKLFLDVLRKRDLLAFDDHVVQIRMAVSRIWSCSWISVAWSFSEAPFWSRPSMIAINPLVLVPPIRSKYWQGRGVSCTPLRRWISSISSLKINSDKSPWTPLHPRIKSVGSVWLYLQQRCISSDFQRNILEPVCVGWGTSRDDVWLSILSRFVCQPKILD